MNLEKPKVGQIPIKLGENERKMNQKQVEKFSIPCNFMAMEMEEDIESPTIFGWLFLAMVGP